MLSKHSIFGVKKVPNFQKSNTNKSDVQKMLRIERFTKDDLDLLQLIS